MNIQEASAYVDKISSENVKPAFTALYLFRYGEMPDETPEWTEEQMRAFLFDVLSNE